MLAKVNACAVIGLDGVVVDVEVDLTPGIKPPIIIVGLPDVSVQESRERGGTVGLVMLEDRVQADHRHLGRIEGGGDALRLRQAVADAAGAEHLEHLDREDAPAEIRKREGAFGVQPLGNVEGRVIGHVILPRSGVAHRAIARW